LVKPTSFELGHPPSN